MVYGSNLGNKKIIMKKRLMIGKTNNFFLKLCKNKIGLIYDH